MATEGSPTACHKAASGSGRLVTAYPSLRLGSQAVYLEACALCAVYACARGDDHKYCVCKMEEPCSSGLVVVCSNFPLVVELTSFVDKLCWCPRIRPLCGVMLFMRGGASFPLFVLYRCPSLFNSCSASLAVLGGSVVCCILGVVAARSGDDMGVSHLMGGLPDSLSVSLCFCWCISKLCKPV